MSLYVLESFELDTSSARKPLGPPDLLQWNAWTLSSLQAGNFIHA